MLYNDNNKREEDDEMIPFLVCNLNLSTNHSVSESMPYTTLILLLLIHFSFSLYINLKFLLSSPYLLI
jgi:hypothetical protein